MASASTDHSSIIPLLSRALHQIRSTPPRVIASPATQPRRAAVALILRVSPPPNFNSASLNQSPSSSPSQNPAPSLTEFFKLDWVNAPGARPEILFLRREKPDGSTDGSHMSGSGPGTREAHVAFPGGRTEEGDEGGMYTAMRQTWEEIGLDLAENAYTPIGQLDDREITTSLGKRLLMILSPFVFLQVTPHTTPVDPAPGTALHWVPLTELLPDILTCQESLRPNKKSSDVLKDKQRKPQWSNVTVDASSRLAPRHSTILRVLVRLLVGNMQFPAIVITTTYPTDLSSLSHGDEKSIDEKRAHVENGGSGVQRQGSLSKLRPRKRNEELKLWGLSLGMTLDLLAHLTPVAQGHGNGFGPNGKGAFIPPDAQAELLGLPVLAPSLTSVFPRFSYPDVNFWIWVFGKRYREVVRGWEASVRAGGTNDRRINWTGSALNTFYAAGLNKIRIDSRPTTAGEMHDNSTQVILSILTKADGPVPPWVTNALIHAPSCVASLSMLAFLGQIVYSRFFAMNYTRHGAAPETRSRLGKHTGELGGPSIFAFKCVRLIATLALTGLLSLSTTFATRHDERNWPGSILELDVFYDALFVVFIYASTLALISVFGSAKWSATSSTHLTLVSLATWFLFIYRDVWPLCTFTLSPVDAAEGWLLWTKLALLSLTGVVTPLISPRQFTPIDPEDGPTGISPTDTASVLSMAIHSYCDSIVYKANRVEHLKIEELPALSGKDRTKTLVNKSFQHLDPLQGKKRHIALALIFWVFRWEYLEMALMLFIRVFVSFLGPLGINRLLKYIETGGEGALVRPWIWVLWLFLGPTLGAITNERYMYLGTRVFTKAQSIITQLIFDHALRMRVKSDTPKTGDNAVTSGAQTLTSTTPDRASIAESSSGAATTTGENQDNADNVSVTTSATEVPAPKGKVVAAAAVTSKPALAEENDGKKANKDFVGRLNNLVTSDLATLQSGQAFMLLFIWVPCQLVFSMILLHSMLGWSVYPGIAVMAVMSPLPGYTAKLMRSTQVLKSKKSDTRVQGVTETMNVIRMVKLFGYETKIGEQLNEKRQDELKVVRKLKILQVFNSVMNNLIPLGTIVATYGTYTVIMKQSLEASTVFASMAIFEIVQEHFAGMFYIIPPIIAAKVSLDRMNDFLNETELLDEFASKKSSHSVAAATPRMNDDIIGFREAAFTWSAEADGTGTPGSRGRNFTLRIEDDLFFKRGCINLVIGQTGSGKTSLLMALLGEMHFKPSGPNSLVSLPRKGGVAYHAQESWVLNETIRENILFGSPYDEQRYDSVIEQCGLKPDLALFDAGDKTEVGEKGLTLSGGQKARITLARAVYSSADILLLDDVLAALDVHTAKWIVDKCFRGELLRDRTVILVTHNIALTSSVADFVVSLSADGRVASQGSLSSALAKDKKLQSEHNKERQILEKGDQVAEKPTAGNAPVAEANVKSSGKLIVEEEIALGHIGWSAMSLYLSNMTGRTGAIPFWTAFSITLIASKVFSQLDMWVLGLWASAYEDHPPSQVSVSYYLTLYSSIIMLSFSFYASCYTLWILGTVRASERIHQILVKSVLGSTLRWLDRTPISRVIARCTQDIASIDSSFPSATYYVIDVGFQILMKFGAVIIISPIFSIPGLVVFAVGAWFGHVYMRAQLPIKRESSTAKAPVLGHFGAAITGLVSIRAYGAQAAFRNESYNRIDRFARAQITQFNLNRWVGIRSSTLAGIFSAGLAAYLLYGPQGKSASTTGFALTMAVGFSTMILWFVRLLNMAEVEGNSMERIQQYLSIEQEPEATEAGVPPAYWPASGTLQVEGLTARYSPDGPDVLHGLTFNIKSGERVGIVGRTGSGKSSLTLALLRAIITEGKTYYDGIPTDSVNLDILRSNITIIPQAPELLSGTLRQNLDPFSEHDDAELNDALRAAGLFSLQTDDDENRITLDTAISGGGSNLSVGQRQIMALARAIVRRSKLLILDEATSAIDYETDNIIQTSLRLKLDKDTTLLTVAHRLQTIMDSDRIMVLDAGRIIEFDSPSELLKHENGLLRRLVDESGDKDKLYAMANTGSL
ncbi:hypothetical protein BXZ70DRAFT_1067810 [Cristinia sonorae]|uniref:Uncharacterized protein n=1 Tax=Cristinia sonorae TaxID=1940300 RepID=A0A8K0UFW2_9AGAR|nr:hypothetical protein BXZ70DRAFT_1067810 [Cristinia sonorae]